MKKLLTDQVGNKSDATGSTVSTGSTLMIHAFGNFGASGTVTVKVSTNGTSDGVTTDDLTFTAPGVRSLYIPPGVTYWAETSGSPTSVSCWVAGEGVNS